MLDVTSTTTISGAQCRAARAYLDWTCGRLARETGVMMRDIRTFERDLPIDAFKIRTIARSLQTAGVEFLPLSDGYLGLRFAIPSD